MRSLPLDHPGTADSRSPLRLLWWLARGQWRTLLGGMFFGVVWMSAGAVMPMVIGQAIDHGVAARDGGALLGWALALLGLGLVVALSGIMRHRFAVTNWLITAYRTVQLVGRHTVHLGGALPRKVSTGEVVAVGTSDLSHLGGVMDVSARFAGAIVAFLLISVILLSTSTTLGLVVLLGAPLLMLAVGPLLAPLQRRSTHQRELMGRLSNTASDIVGGLRVLRGVGGEQVFHDRYRRESQRTRRAGVQVARLQSVLEALEVFLPGVFVVLVVWLGARYAVDGRITPGQLVSLYGYAAFLMIPLRTATEYANKLIRALVSARRVCHVLSQTPDVADPVDPAPSPPVGSDLHDVRTGLHVPAGTPGRGGQRAARRLRGPGRPARPLCRRDRRRRAPRRRPAHLAAARRGPRADRGLRHRGDPVLRIAWPRGSTWRTGAATPYAGRSTPPRPTTSSPPCRTGSTRSCPSAAAPSPAASASGWCWPAPWPSTPRCWCWWSRPRRWTPTPRPGSRPGCARTAPAAPRW